MRLTEDSSPVVKDEIVQLLTAAGASAQGKGLLPPLTLPEAPIERPANPAHGDYASSLPLKLARAARMNPMQIARVLVGELPSSAMFARVETAPPGFINFSLGPAWLAEQVNAIVAVGPDFGHIPLGRGERVQVEFVSANPTGPLTAASGRGGALGDCLARILQLAGYRTSREYYVNDTGAQLEAFSQTLYARYAQLLGRDVPVPAHGYHGSYMIDLAREILAAEGERYLSLPPEQAAAELGRIGRDRLIADARATLADMGIVYDCWFSEQSLYDSSLVARVLDLLRQSGYVEDREGAVWFTSSALGESPGDQKDNVLVRSNGIPTYFASDIAYHYDKLVIRGFDRVIDIWGADHQGHVPRMKAAITALGIDPDRLPIIIHQMITLRRGEEIVRMSKRTGDIVTLREVLDEVGADAARFFFLSRSADAHMDFDLDLAARQSKENPVYYVQYAHARTASILRNAGPLDDGSGDVSLLRHDAELALIKKMLQFPEVVELAARNDEPHHIPHYALELASVFQQEFYEHCRVLSDDEAQTRARLKLVRAAKAVLGNTLRLMGIGAPEQM
ncbi:MAG: arginine--tRNA ligase [Chloroflexi bacterium]|nr:arginine--tRNA ligase [Chloroflexota bacterium]